MQTRGAEIIKSASKKTSAWSVLEEEEEEKEESHRQALGFKAKGLGHVPGCFVFLIGKTHTACTARQM